MAAENNLFTFARVDSLCLGAAIAILMGDEPSAAICRRAAPWVAGGSFTALAMYWIYRGYFSYDDAVVQIGGFPFCACCLEPS